MLVNWEGSIQEVHEFIKEVNNKDKNLQFKEEIGGKQIRGPVSYTHLDVYKRQTQHLEIITHAPNHSPFHSHGTNFYNFIYWSSFY